MTDARKAHWEMVYGGRDSRDVSWFQAHPEPGLGLILQHADAARRGIIDIGAGASLLADALLEAGFDAIGLLDISEAALAETSRRIATCAGKVEFIAADITR